MKSKCFEDVVVWKKAHQFVLEVYRFSKLFPKSEWYGLTQQFRKAAISIPANFAEGFKKISNRDKIRFYNIAQGSLEECRYYLILTKDLNYGDSSILMLKLEEVSKLLSSYINAINHKK